MSRRRQHFPRHSTTATIEKFSHDARGIARVDGKITFIDGALPGETVMFQYTQKKKGFDEGRLLSLVSPSIFRVEPPCPHYSMCGGCSLQHLDPDTQIQVKQEQLLDLLARVGKTAPLRVLPPLVADRLHYRNKARLSVRFIEKTQTVVVGFRERHKPEYITAMTQCLVLNQRLEPLIGQLSAFIKTLDAPGQIPQVDVAVGDDEVALIVRHLSVLSLADEERLCAFAKMTSVRLFLQSGGPETVRLLYPEGASEFLTYTLPEQNLSFQFHPTDFTQVNAVLNQRMVTQALEVLALEPDDVVLDLFCGLGNFSLPMARQCVRVIGVEGCESMVTRARMNALANGLTNTVFECVNLENKEELHSLSAYRAGTMLIDPPRTGALALVQQIQQINPKRLLYISCDPATLARDTAILVHEKGYQLLTAGVMDMFPHTAHVEAMALFQK